MHGLIAHFGTHELIVQVEQEMPATLLAEFEYDRQNLVTGLKKDHITIITAFELFGRFGIYKARQFLNGFGFGSTDFLNHGIAVGCIKRDDQAVATFQFLTNGRTAAGGQQ